MVLASSDLNYLYKGGGYAIRSVCLTFCLCEDYCKSTSDQPISLELDVMIGPSS